MDVKQLKSRVLEYLSKIKTLLKEAWSLPYAKLYILLAFVMTIFFMFVTFPYEILIRNQLQKLESTIGRNIQIGVIDFSVWGDSYIDFLSITFSGGSELTLKDITMNIAINPYTLLLKKNVRGDIGITSLKYAGGDSLFNNSLKSAFDIRLDPKSGFPSDGFLNIDLGNVYFKGINIRGFDIPPVKFSSIQGAAVIRNRRMNIQKLIMKGKDAEGEIKGSILFEPMARSSKINIYIYINSDSLILQEYKMLLDNMLQIENNRIKIEISGTLGSPSVKMPFKSSTADFDKPGNGGPGKDGDDRGPAGADSDDNGEPRL